MAIVSWRQRLRGAERGSVLLGGLMLVFIITLVGSGVFTAAVLENRMALKDTSQTQVWYIAAAGLSAAKQELADGDGTNDFAAVFTTGTSVTLFANKAVGAGSFTVTAQTVTGSSPNQVTVTSTGCVPAANPCLTSNGNAKAMLQTTVTRTLGLGGPFVGLDKFTIRGTVDSFDSSVGAYGVPPPSTNNRCQNQTSPFTTDVCGADIRTNGLWAVNPNTGVVDPTFETVTIGNNTNVYGDITAARGRITLGNNVIVWGNVTYHQTRGSCVNCIANTTVKGNITAATSIADSPLLSYQDCSGGGLHYTPAQGNNPNIPVGFTSTANISYSATTGVLSLSGNGDTTIASGTYCFSNFTLQNGTINLNIVNSVPVILQIGKNPNVSGSGKINLGGNGFTNVTNKPDMFQILSNYISQCTQQQPCSDAGVTLRGGASAYLYVFAPQTLISISGGSDLYGALLGLYVDSGGNNLGIHFDRHLQNVGDLAGGVPAYTMGAWTQL